MNSIYVHTPCTSLMYMHLNYISCQQIPLLAGVQLLCMNILTGHPLRLLPAYLNSANHCGNCKVSLFYRPQLHHVHDCISFTAINRQWIHFWYNNITLQCYFKLQKEHQLNIHRSKKPKHLCYQFNCTPPDLLVSKVKVSYCTKNKQYKMNCTQALYASI